VIELREVTLDYPERPGILSQISGIWQAGETIGLIGPNGSGKSSLLKTLACLLPYRGQITCDGVELSRMAARRRAELTCYLPQQVVYQQAFTGSEAALMGCYSRLNRWGQPSLPEQERVHHCLQRVGASHLAQRSVRAMSGGEVQRIRLAQALVQDAAYWLLDEPTSALDLHQQIEVFDLFVQLRQQGKGLLVVLHDLNLARRLCSRWWVMAEGRLRLQGPPDDLIQRPEFQEIFQVSMDFFQNSQGESLLWPKKLTPERGSDTL